MAFRQDTDKSSMMTAAGGWSVLDPVIAGQKAPSPAQPTPANEAGAEVPEAELTAQDEAKQMALANDAYAPGGDGLSYALRARQQMAQQVGEDSGLVMVNQGPTNQMTREDREEEKKDQAAAALEDMVETSQQSLKREREEQIRKLEAQWREEKNRFLDQDYSDEEIERAEQGFRDPKRVAALKKKLRDSGLSSEKTDRSVEIAQTLAGLNRRVETGELTEAEAQKIKNDLTTEAKADPKLKSGVARSMEFMAQNNEMGRDLDTIATTTQHAGAGTQAASVDAYDQAATEVAAAPPQTMVASSATSSAKISSSGSADGTRLFASAPPAGEHFAAAANAVTSPTSAPKPAPAATAASAVKPDALVC